MVHAPIDLSSDYLASLARGLEEGLRGSDEHRATNTVHRFVQLWHGSESDRSVARAHIPALRELLLRRVDERHFQLGEIASAVAQLGEQGFSMLQEAFCRIVTEERIPVECCQVPSGSRLWRIAPLLALCPAGSSMVANLLESQDVLDRVRGGVALICGAESFEMSRAFAKKALTLGLHQDQAELIASGAITLARIGPDASDISNLIAGLSGHREENPNFFLAQEGCMAALLAGARHLDRESLNVVLLVALTGGVPESEYLSPPSYGGTVAASNRQTILRGLAVLAVHGGGSSAPDVVEGLDSLSNLPEPSLLRSLARWVQKKSGARVSRGLPESSATDVLAKSWDQFDARTLSSWIALVESSGAKGVKLSAANFGDDLERVRRTELVADAALGNRKALEELTSLPVKELKSAVLSVALDPNHPSGASAMSILTYHCPKDWQGPDREVIAAIQQGAQAVRKSPAPFFCYIEAHGESALHVLPTLLSVLDDPQLGPFAGRALGSLGPEIGQPLADGISTLGTEGRINALAAISKLDGEVASKIALTALEELNSDNAAEAVRRITMIRAPTPLLVSKIEDLLRPRRLRAIVTESLDRYVRNPQKGVLSAMEQAVGERYLIKQAAAAALHAWGARE